MGSFLREMTKMALILILTVCLMSLVQRSDEKQLSPPPPPPLSAFQQEHSGYRSRSYLAQEDSELDAIR